MNRKYVWIFQVAAACTTTSCVHAEALHGIKMVQCAISGLCKASGMLEMSSDGHGFIGVLRFPDGTCINVSLPDKESEALLGKSQSFRTVIGVYKTFNYNGQEIMRINGRRVGIGNCNTRYLFQIQ